MKLLYRHITKELIGPFLFGVAAFTSIMFAGKELFNITELLAEYRAPLFVGVKLVLLAMPSIIVITLPMAMLLSALLGFGRLSGDSESVALFASGISLYRIAIPVIIMAVLVTGLSFVLSEVVAPKAFREHERVFREFKAERNGGGNKPFMAIDTQDGKTKSIAYVPPGGLRGNKLYNLLLFQYENDKPALFIFAKEAEWTGGNSLATEGQWVMLDGYVRYLNPEAKQEDGVQEMLTFDNLKLRLLKLNKTPEQLQLYQLKPEELSFNELRDFIAALQKEGQDVAEYRVRLYQKIALPLASLVFALIGTPLGLRPQRSSSAVGLGFSIVIIFAYWVLMHYMTILGKNGAITPAAAAFIPTLLGLGVGAALLVRASK